MSFTTSSQHFCQCLPTSSFVACCSSFWDWLYTIWALSDMFQCLFGQAAAYILANVFHRCVVWWLRLCIICVLLVNLCATDHCRCDIVFIRLSQGNVRYLSIGFF